MSEGVRESVERREGEEGGREVIDDKRNGEEIRNRRKGMNEQ